MTRCDDCLDTLPADESQWWWTLKPTAEAGDLVGVDRAFWPLYAENYPLCAECAAWYGDEAWRCDEVPA